LILAWTREEMAARAARDLKDGYCVNLGMGIPPPGWRTTSPRPDRDSAERERDAGYRIELAPGVTQDNVKQKTEADYLYG
jgi:acyl CoA:acetate/3-ketoacid CoA transferase beta subunit